MTIGSLLQLWPGVNRRPSLLTRYNDGHGGGSSAAPHLIHPLEADIRHDHTTTPDQTGQTLAAVVRAILPGLSWRRAQDLCASGRVTVDGAVTTDSAQRIIADQRLVVDPEGRRQRTDILPDDAILYLDRDLVVVRKPAGMLTVPWEIDDGRITLADVTRAALQRRDRPTGLRHLPPLGVVSRLDKDTTGVVVFARTEETREQLERQFEAHSIERRYLAIAHGAPPEGTLESMLVANRGDGIRGSLGVFAAHAAPKGPPPGAQRAVTRVRILERLARATLVECTLETGRKHQIRIHLAEAGCPVVGEAIYIRDFRGPPIPAPRPMLHAAVLGFTHPRTGRIVRVEDPPPEDFVAMAERLRGEEAG